MKSVRLPMLGVLGVALLWSLYPAVYMLSLRGSDALFAFGWLLAFDLGKLSLAMVFAFVRPGPGAAGWEGWRRSPWFWLFLWHSAVTLWIPVGFAYAGAGVTVLILEAWPLPSGLLLIWGRQGWQGLRNALSPALVLAGLLCVGGVFLIVTGGRDGGLRAESSGRELSLGLLAAFLGLTGAVARVGGVLFAGRPSLPAASGAGGGRSRRSDFWHACASGGSVAFSLLAGLIFSFGGVGMGLLLLAFGHGLATMAGHRVLNRVLLFRQEPVLHLPLYALPFAGVGWLWLFGLERPAQPVVFLLGGCLILAGNLLALRRL